MFLWLGDVNMYAKSKITALSGIIATLSSFVGIIFFFINIRVTTICAILLIIDSFIQVIFGEQKNLITETLTIIISIIVALIIRANILNIIAFALCLATALLSIIGWIHMLITVIKYRF